MKSEKPKTFVMSKYFEWTADVCKLMGKPLEYGNELVKDPNWFGCWDDRMTPQQAIDEARSKGIIE